MKKSAERSHHHEKRGHSGKKYPYQPGAHTSRRDFLLKWGVAGAVGFTGAAAALYWLSHEKKPDAKELRRLEMEKLPHNPGDITVAGGTKTAFVLDTPESCKLWHVYSNLIPETGLPNTSVTMHTSQIGELLQTLMEISRERWGAAKPGQAGDPQVKTVPENIAEYELLFYPEAEPSIGLIGAARTRFADDAAMTALNIGDYERMLGTDQGFATMAELNKALSSAFCDELTHLCIVNRIPSGIYAPHPPAMDGSRQLTGQMQEERDAHGIRLAFDTIKNHDPALSGDELYALYTSNILTNPMSPIYFGDAPDSQRTIPGITLERKYFDRLTRFDKPLLEVLT